MKFFKKSRTACIVGAMMFVPQIIFAQSHFASKVSVGMHAGADFSQISFYPSVPQSFLPGVTAGIAIRYIEENHFGIIAECNFTQRGWKEDFKDTSQFNYSRTINYIEIPVYAHIYFGSQKARFFVNAGPEINFFLAESTSSNFNPYEISVIPNFPNKNRATDQMLLPVQKKVDYGISGGLGIEFQINKRHSIFLEGRFYYGLGNIFNDKRIDPFGASNSMTISATAGWWFRLK